LYYKHSMYTYGDYNSKQTTYTEWKKKEEGSDFQHFTQISFLLYHKILKYACTIEKITYFVHVSVYIIYKYNMNIV